MSFNMNDPDNDDIMADINMTPLIDIMLVLLILFMVTSSVSLESGLDIKLPEVGGVTEKKEESAVIVSLTENGEVLVQGSSVEASSLKEEISKALIEASTNLVILEGDKKSNLGSAVEIMDIAKEAGAQEFAIAAENSL